MGRPKQQDYEASEEEKVSASVAKANYDFFKSNYAPLLKQMRDQSQSDDNRLALRGRASADTMQALTSQPTYMATQDVEGAGDISQALAGQLGVADKAAKNIQNTAATNVLGVARGQAADAASGMAKASRLATSDALARARGKQQVRSARTQALGKIAGAGIMKYGEETGNEGIGKFFDAMGAVG
jgi:hypothetical protein|tara:strand:- start:5306 stop:5860 length:555 start_codon:yes stop_codon:yes gene_type:complete